jgi:carbon storage regulator CsrA
LPVLILTRKVDEKIKIITKSGEVITVMVVEASSSKAKLGIDAPADYRIYREEVLEQIKSQKRQEGG